jgi:hypothetical protein
MQATRLRGAPSLRVPLNLSKALTVKRRRYGLEAHRLQKLSFKNSRFRLFYKVLGFDTSTMEQLLALE